MSSHSPITYLVRNRLSADILLPYPSCDPHPKEILWIGQCMLADERLLKALDGWLEIIDVIEERKTDRGPVLGEVGISKENSQASDVAEDFLFAWWEMTQGRFVRVQLLTDLAANSGKLLPTIVQLGTTKARLHIGKILRAWCEANPPGWKIQHRERSHTIEYRISPAR